MLVSKGNSGVERQDREDGAIPGVAGRGSHWQPPATKQHISSTQHSPPRPVAPPCFSTASLPWASIATAVAATVPPRAAACSDTMGAQPAASAVKQAPCCRCCRCCGSPVVVEGAPHSTASGASACSRDRRGRGPSLPSSAPSCQLMPSWPFTASGSTSVCRRSSPLRCPVSSTVVLRLRRYEPNAVTGEAVPACGSRAEQEGG